MFISQVVSEDSDILVALKRSACTKGVHCFRARLLFDDTQGFQLYYKFVSVIEYHAKVGLDQPFSFLDQRH